jgi:hypothetical protein
MTLKDELEHINPIVEQSPWRGHEHVRGYGIFGLPLSSGHTLALRVFPINDFSPYVTVWHQTPDGTWSIYYDARRSDIACPRYYGPAVQYIVPAEINLIWRGPMELMIKMRHPQLEWTVHMKEPLILSLLNKLSKRMPLWTWKYRLLLRLREWMARPLGIGTIKLAGRMPSGHFGILMPQRMYLIDRACVKMQGVDLGIPMRVRPNPKIGDVPLPARGVFAIGQAHWEIFDEAEYVRTKTELMQTNSKSTDLQFKRRERC